MITKLGYFFIPVTFTASWVCLFAILLVAGYSPMPLLTMGGSASVGMFLLASVYRRFAYLATENRSLRATVQAQEALLRAESVSTS